MLEPIQLPKIWVPDFDQIIRVNFKFLKKSKRYRFNKKTKVNGLQPDF